MTVLFRKNRELEARIDEYFDQIVQGGMLWRYGLRLFLDHRKDEAEDRLRDLRATEQRADDLRRQVESHLYLHTLIPEYRGDVLGLLEGADRVLNRITLTLLRFSVEEPELESDLNPLLLELADHSQSAAESMVRGCRAYFRDLAAVRDHISLTQFHRDEANKASEKYTRAVFRRPLRLSHKNQHRYFASYIEEIAEQADDVCDRLAIAAIKRVV